MSKYFFLLPAALLLSVSLRGQALNEDRFLVKPYLQFSTQHQISILWETTQPATTQVVYGPARSGVQKPVMDQIRMVSGNHLMHEVTLEFLEPETNYFWQVTSVTEKGDTLRSGIYTFKTAVKDSSAFMFALIGDTQRNSRTPWAWRKIAEKVWQDRPNFVVLAGDLVDQGLQKTDWTEQFFPDGHPLMSRVTVFPVLGNHEQDAPYYYQYIVAPQPEYYYTFTYGNVQFFMLDSNRDLAEGSEQYQWLEWELAKSKADWKIAVHHHPPYSSDSDDHGDTFNGAVSTLGDANTRNLVPLYEQYGLDFCLFGHTHLYERSWPLKDNMINKKEGVVYINSGGAGGGLENFAPTRSWFTQELQVEHHYCTFNIFENNLVFKAIDHEGRLLDMFQMEKDLSGAARRASVAVPPSVHLHSDATLFQQQTNLSMSAAFPDMRIHYTLDGSEPHAGSPRYEGPMTIDRSLTVRARAYTPDGRAGRLSSLSFRKSAPLPAKTVKTPNKGLQYSYYEGKWDMLPDFTNLTPVKKGTVTQAHLEGTGHRDNHFALVLEGYVDFPETRLYELYINSDDGSKLYIDGELVVDHDGDHSAIKKTGKTILAAGKHQIRIEFFEASGGQFLQAGIMDAVLGPVPFTPFQLSY